MFWEELTAPDFVKAVKESNRTCIVPVGVIERHGNHLPLVTDLLIGRELAKRIAAIEPVVIFPQYYFAPIAEARVHPGTISISGRLQQELLEEVCSEIARNGFNKIILLPCHGPNIDFLKHFIRNTLNKRIDYVVYSIHGFLTKEQLEDINKLIGFEYKNGHGGIMETSQVMASRPDLVKMQDYDPEFYTNMNRLEELEGVFTANWWYAKYPNHLSSDPKGASAEIGNKVLDYTAQNLALIIKKIKNDTKILEIQKEFFDNCIDGVIDYDKWL